MLFICYKKCSTCREVAKLLDSAQLHYDSRDIKDNPPTVAELKTWHEQSGLPLKRFFNTSGMRYRELNLKDRLESMSDQEKYELLASDGMLVKRPILVDKDSVWVGPDVKKHLNSMR